ncbi:MAG: hypothetical protein ND895_21530 [Pyrinomonadaceae bacterium]|nr:hypothetical protein [Pyrinomonadaceae bacterium]
MTQPIQLTDVWRRSLDATVQFYSTMGKLAFECLETLLATAGNSSSDVKADGDRPISVSVDREPASTKPNPVPASMMVLEAAAGGTALGVFLVENGFSRAVSAVATASAFVDEDGNEINPAVEFQPAAIMLQPGEQVLVKVLASISKDIPAGIRYRGEIGVPGLMGTRIPVVLGRTAEAKSPTSKKRNAASPASARGRIPDHNSSPRRKSKKRAASA